MEHVFHHLPTSQRIGNNYTNCISSSTLTLYIIVSKEYKLLKCNCTQIFRSILSTMSSSFSNRSTHDRSGQSWSTSYKDTDTSYKPASHRSGENVSPSKGVTPTAHPVFGVPKPDNFKLKSTVSVPKFWNVYILE